MTTLMHATAHTRKIGRAYQAGGVAPPATEWCLQALSGCCCRAAAVHNILAPQEGGKAMCEVITDNWVCHCAVEASSDVNKKFSKCKEWGDRLMCIMDSG